jgi:hypothetical protein
MHQGTSGLVLKDSTSHRKTVLQRSTVKYSAVHASHTQHTARVMHSCNGHPSECSSEAETATFCC